MSRNYQHDRVPFDPYDQAYDSGFSSQNREYSDLYDPNKSIWNQALHTKSTKRSAKLRQTYPHRQGEKRIVPEGGSGYPQNFGRNIGKPGQGVLHLPERMGPYYSLPQTEEEVFDSGYDVTRRNTYGYRTTGYGPRD